MKQYVCAICGKNHVKLWRPHMDVEPLACATCLEKRQTLLRYKECDMSGKPTDKIHTLPSWKIDSDGNIVSSTDVSTNKLIVDLRDVSNTYTSGSTTMIPAVPKDDGDFYGYATMPEEACKWWESLPTK